MANKVLKTGYSAWIKPSEENLAQEYKVEYQLKPGLRRELGPIWPTFESFMDSINNNSKVVKFDQSKDRMVDNRSRTVDQEDLLDLIRGYASYPEFRNEKTVQNLYDRIKANKPLHMPLILKMPQGYLRIMSGNTRADVAMQLVGSYTALVIDASNMASKKGKNEKKQMFEALKMVYPELLRLKEQTMSDIVVPVETEVKPEDEFDPTVPKVNSPVPFPKNNDNLFVDSTVEESIHSKLVQVFSGERYAELGAMVGMLEGLSVLFQTLHWQVNGQSFYGDHKMFQQIYGTFGEQIDSLAEKTVDLGSSDLVDSKKLTKALDLFLNHIRSSTPTPHGMSDDSKQSFSIRGKYALEVFIQTTEKMMAELEEKGLLTKGLDNLLAGILDVQEGNHYLLKQRVIAGF